MADPLDALVNSLKANNKLLSSLNSAILKSTTSNTVSSIKSSRNALASQNLSKSLFDVATEVAAVLYPINQALQFQVRYSSAGLKLSDVINNKLEMQTNVMTRLEGGIDLLTIGMEKHGSQMDLLAGRARLLGENSHELLMDLRDYSNSLGLLSDDVNNLARNLVKNAETYKVSTSNLIEAMSALKGTLAASVMAGGQGALGSQSGISEFLASAGRRGISSAQYVLASLLQPGSQSFKSAAMFGIEDIFQKITAGDLSQGDIVSMLERVVSTSESITRGMDFRLIPDILQNIGNITPSMVGEMRLILNEISKGNKIIYDEATMVAGLNTTMMALKDASMSLFMILYEYATRAIKMFPVGWSENVLTTLVTMASTLIAINGIHKAFGLLISLFSTKTRLLTSLISLLVGVGSAILINTNKANKTAEKALLRSETRAINQNPYGLSQDILRDMLKIKYEKDNTFNSPREQNRLLEEQNRRLEGIAKLLQKGLARDIRNNGIVSK